MTQSEINRAVALVTGESICTVSQLGFSLADPAEVEFDPEPYDLPPQTVDWDELDASRNMPLLPALA